MGDVGMDDHQVCIAHLLRNLTYTMQAFQDDAWSLNMLDLLRDFVHQRRQKTIRQYVGRGRRGLPSPTSYRRRSRADRTTSRPWGIAALA